MPTKAPAPASTAKTVRNGGAGAATAGVVGLGYVGLPLLVEMARAGLQSCGFDVDPIKCKEIAAGRSTIEDITDADLEPLVKNKSLQVATDWSALSGMDAISICVPTPLRKSKEPDISFIHSAASTLAPHLQPGQLVILESTTYPGTTREIVLPILEATGLKVGVDFWLAFSPERVDPGNVVWPLNRIPKVIGGITPECTKRAAEFYSRVFETVHPVSNAEAAEMAKLLENTFRAVDIGLVNEFALACHRLGIDTWEVVRAAGTKPFGFMSFKPGPGIGGHCIPVDPQYLSWKMRLLNFTTRFIDLAEEVNSEMPRHTVQRLLLLLNDKGKALSRSKILVVGVAYKNDVSDVRESPALDIIGLLLQQKATVDFHDPMVAKIDVEGKTLNTIELTKKVIKDYDAAVIITPHTSIDMKLVTENSPLVLDCRGVTSGMTAENIHRL